MPRPRNPWSAEPAILIGAFRAVLFMVVGFGLDLSVEQVTSIILTFEAVLTLLTRASVFSPAAVVQIQADNAAKVLEAAAGVVVTDAPIVLAEALNADVEPLDPNDRGA